MKRSLSSFFAFAIVCAGLLSIGTPYSLAAQSSATLSKKELKSLLAAAKTPAEHRTIASYYRHQAEDYTKRSAEHAAMAEQFATGSAISQSKPGIQGAIHCRYFANEFGEQAKKAVALAATHEEMATKAAQQ